MKITAKHRQAIAALLQQPTITKAAAEVGVTKRTLYNWLADSDFRAELDAAETALIESVARQVSTAADEAAQVLRSVMSDENASTGEKIRAARAVLAALPQLRLLGSIERRLNELGKQQ